MHVRIYFEDTMLLEFLSLLSVLHRPTYNFGYSSLTCLQFDVFNYIIVFMHSKTIFVDR